MPSREPMCARVASWTFRDSLLNKGMASVGPAFNFNDNLDQCFQSEQAEASSMQAGYVINDSVQIIELSDLSDNGQFIREFREKPFMFPNRTIQTYSLADPSQLVDKVFAPQNKGSQVWAPLSN